jgi:hypothetical protein
MAHVVQCLPRKCQALSSNPNTRKSKKKKKKITEGKIKEFRMPGEVRTWNEDGWEEKYAEFEGRSTADRFDAWKLGKGVTWRLLGSGNRDTL